MTGLQAGRGSRINRRARALIWLAMVMLLASHGADPVGAPLSQRDLYTCVTQASVCHLGSALVARSMLTHTCGISNERASRGRLSADCSGIEEKTSCD